MTVWYNLNLTLRMRTKLLIAVGFLLFAVLITTIYHTPIVHAVPNVTKTMSFQGRLQSSSGAIVPDGYYNIQFKIYQDGAGTAAGNPGGALKWTESYVNNNTSSGVQIKNGYFSVDLGSKNPFGTAVDWNQDTLFLSMNIAGNANACTTFDSAPCGADGEMLPMKRMSATPFSLNSNAVGGKTANELVQLGQGVQTDASNNSSIAINKTGTGNLIQLQAGGKDSFTVNNAGAVTLGSASDQSITVATADSGAGKSLTVSGGDAATGSGLAGGDLVLQGGAGDDQATSGNVIVAAKDADSTGTFQVQDAAGTTLLNVDTINKVVSAGTISLISSASKGAADTVSLWGGGAANGTAYDDGTPIVLGTAFKSTVSGVVTGIRYYSPAGGTSSGNNTGQLWACADASCLAEGGSVMGSVNFAADSTEGWKTAQFLTPISITPNTYYVVSYKTTTGIYYASSHYFDGEYNRGVLSAPSSDTIRNGRFNDQNNGWLPSSSFNNTNYWADVTFVPATDVDQINSDNELIISSAGPMTVGPASQSLTMQGSSIDIGAKSGGNVTIQGGGATVADGNGGSVYLSGGAGSGTGADGLVVLSTPTYATVTNDANCYTGGAVVAASCTITTTSVNSSSSIILGFSATGQIATLPDPTNKTAGRIMYITAAGASADFTLRANSGGGAGVEQTIAMRKNTTATLLWDGTNWSTAGGGSSTSLQNAYNNTPQNAAGSDIIVSNDGAGTGGLTIQDSVTSPLIGPILDVKNAAGDKLFSVNSKVVDGTEYAADGGVHDAAGFATNWTKIGAGTVSRITTDGQEGGDSAQAVTTTASNDGIRNVLSIKPAVSKKYKLSVYAKLVSGSAFNNVFIRYSPNQGSSFVNCSNYNTQTITTGAWTKITCDFTTSATTATIPYINITQPTSPAAGRTFLVDAMSLTLDPDSASNVKIGTGAGSGNATLFTLDKSATSPVASGDDSLLGSMYYDTTLGTVRCYESAGWGSCGAKPDSFITISPEYTNAVMNGTAIGTVTSDLCSDSLNINDGSSGQPTICGTNETYNFYNWKSAEATDQTRSIYVTYQLPSNFKNFVPATTSLKARTDSTNATVSYQVYKDSTTGTGLTSCGSVITAATGSVTSWQKSTASGGADPSACSFAAGDSLLFRINMTSKSNANAYVSNLGFVFTNN